MYKVIQSNANSTKATWLFTHGGGGHVKFAGAKKRLANSEEHSKLVTSDESKALKLTETKHKTGDDSNLENGSDKFNFEKIEIRADPNSELLHGRKERIRRPTLYAAGTLDQ